MPYFVESLLNVKEDAGTYFELHLKYVLHRLILKRNNLFATDLFDLKDS
jgi:hypothetical protein